MTPTEPNGFTDPVELAKKAKEATSRAVVLARVLAVYITVAVTWALVAILNLAGDIRDCTNPSGKCWQDNVLQARERTRAFLEDLERQHAELADEFTEIKCILLVLPTERTDDTPEDCRQQGG